jgi:hypothetical protein
MISFPEVPEGNEENEGDQTLMFDKQTLPFQIFQTRPLESLISSDIVSTIPSLFLDPPKRKIRWLGGSPTHSCFLKKVIIL